MQLPRRNNSNRLKLPNVAVGTNTAQGASFSYQNSPSELFHVSYLSSATNQSVLEKHCISQGLKVTAIEETSKQKQLPWRCYRVRISVKAKEDVLNPDLWPAGVTCELSSYNRDIDTALVWGTSLKPESKGLAYLQETSIFIGGCAQDSNTNDIDAWTLKGGAPEAKSITITNSARSKTKAYKIVIPHNRASLLLDENFWPKGVTFRRFRPNPKDENCIVQAPTPIDSIPAEATKSVPTQPNPND